MKQGAMFNAYPNSIGKDLAAMTRFLSLPELKEAFGSFYILPTVFNTDLDGGFSVISYELCNQLAQEKDLETLRSLGIDLTFDLILNHLSVLSPQFMDILKNGDSSPFRDFFIDWNRFWQGLGDMTEEGYILPRPDCFLTANLRKKGLPILMVRLPDGSEVPFWNTFYQQVIYPSPDALDLLDITGGQYAAACRLAETVAEQVQNGTVPAKMDFTGLEDYREKSIAWLQSHRKYMGQMDLNARSPLVWQWYDETMGRLKKYGAGMVRLDAFTRLHKESGRSNVLNEPETWDLLEKLKEMAASHDLAVLPEVHMPYRTGAYARIAARGCRTYDYFLPGLLLDALQHQDAAYLCRWATEQIENGYRTVNMLGCHDGIPIRDLRGLLPDERIDALVSALEEQGCRAKWIHGEKDEVYQMCGTYFSALGESEAALLLCRAVQLFMPGVPQVWYGDLLAETNDLTVFERDPGADAREINRRALDEAEAAKRLNRTVVKKQLDLLRLRAAHPAFGEDASIRAELADRHTLRLCRRCGGHSAVLTADLAALTFDIALE